MIEDMVNFLKQLLTSQEQRRAHPEAIDDVSERQIDSHMPMILLAAEFVSEVANERRSTRNPNARYEISADRFEEIFIRLGQTGIKDIGSGDILFFMIACIYFTWLYLRKQRRNVTVLNDYITLNWFFFAKSTSGEEKMSEFKSKIAARRVRNSHFEQERLELIREIGRNVMPYLHVKIQKALGAQDEYWYHGGNDPRSEYFDKVKLSINGISVPRVGNRGEETDIFYHVVGVDNMFWEYVFKIGNNALFQIDCFKHALMMPDFNANGEALTGCFERAVQCVCPNTDAEYCRCHDNVLHYDEIEIGRIPEKYADEPLIVIIINVYTKDSKKKKDYQLLFFSDKYYDNPKGKVIFINNPNWHNGHAHCCLFKPFQYTDEIPETPNQKFSRYSFFNTVLHRLIRTSDSICPICGLVFPKSESHAHFKLHTENICDQCGLTFSTKHELEIHQEYHCRHLGEGCMYDFAESITGYKQPPVIERCIIYADLESAITEEGTHENILCGWVNTKDYDVHISKSIKSLFKYIKEQPEDNILVYFHNGEGYDFHFVLIELSKMEKTAFEKADIVADSSEKFRYFTIHFGSKRVTFKDTFAFVSQSLSSWLESTKRCADADFPCFTNAFKDGIKRNLIMQKNPFPYNAIKDADDLLKDITELDRWFTAENNVELFCDKFTKEELKDIYENWFIKAKDIFKWKSIDDYYKTYLMCDVAQLCDCMEYFCKNVNNEFGLNAHDYYGTPGLTWAAWLKQNTYPLEPVPENGFDLINSSIRGGQTGAMTRYFNSDRGEDDEGSFCCDLDCNALYATVMLRFDYPCCNWKVIDCSDMPLDDFSLLEMIKNYHHYKKSGFVEVDMIVKDDPFIYSYVPVASKRLVKDVYDYPTMRQYANLHGRNYKNFIFSGLCNVVGEHKHYCGHTKLFEFYLSHGFIEIKKVYRMIIGDEHPVFSNYVDHNLAKRKEFADDPIKKMLYKLMNNALYGKTYEDVTQRRDVRISKTSDFGNIQDSMIKRTLMVIGEYTIYEAPKRSFVMDKPIYLGAAITEFSKLWMYRFFYDEVKPKFPSCEVLYTDTDALTLKFPPECRITSFLELATALNYGSHQVLDTSNWPNVDELADFHKQHNNEPGLFKSETGYGRIIRMVALRAKTYIMECDNGEIKMSVKGCPMKEKAKLTFDDFKNILFRNTTEKEIEYDAIVSKYHIVKSTQLTRVVLSADDRKRYIADDKIHTYPLFSKPHQEALIVYDQTPFSIEF